MSVKAYVSRIHIEANSNKSTREIIPRMCISVEAGVGSAKVAKTASSQYPYTIILVIPGIPDTYVRVISNLLKISENLESTLDAVISICHCIRDTIQLNAQRPRYRSSLRP